MRLRHALALVLANVLGLAVVLGGLEAGARAFFPRRAVALFEDPELRIRKRPFVVPHPTRGFALNPGFHEGQYRVNARGFRGEELPPDPGAFFTVVALGDSTTFGFRVGNAQTYPFYLQQLLRERVTARSALVVNGGVPSYTSSQVRVTLEEVLPELRPDLVIVSVMWNDVWFSTLRHWYPEALVFQQPAPWRRFLMAHSGLYRALALPAESDEADVDVFNHDALALYRQNLERMVEACRARRVALVFMDPPFAEGYMGEAGVNPFHQTRLTKPFLLRVVRGYLDALWAVAAAHDVPVLRHRLSAAVPASRYDFLDPLHPKAKGYSAIARDAAVFLAERRLLPPRAGH